MVRMSLFKNFFKKSLLFAFHHYPSLQLVYWGGVAEPSLWGLAKPNVFTLKSLVIILIPEESTGLGEIELPTIR